MPKVTMTCPFKPAPENGVVALPGGDPRPPSNACTMSCALFLQQLDDQGKVTPLGCAFGTIATILGEIQQRLPKASPTPPPPVKSS